MGLPKVGKTSIKKVVFEKVLPHETVFLNKTETIESLEINNLYSTTGLIRDFPRDFSFDKISIQELSYFKTCSVLIYVIDFQEIKEETYDDFKETIVNVFHHNPKISVEIFLHKADGAYFLKTGNMNKHRSEVQTRVKDILLEINMEINIGFYSTSIYDHSLYEAFSKIYQKIIPQNNLLSGLLDNLATSCRFEKSYLFDVYNKIFIAIDSSPMEEQLYEICSDMIDVVSDMSGIYGENSTNLKESSNFDENSYSIFHISKHKDENSKSHLYLRFLDENLALICIINDDNFERQHLIDYNIKIFKDAVREMFKN